MLPRVGEDTLCQVALVHAVPYMTHTVPLPQASEALGMISLQMNKIDGAS